MRLPRDLRRKMPLTWRHAADHRWDASRTGGGHVELSKGRHRIVCPSSPSDPRSDLNARSYLRKCERGQCQCRTAMKERAS